jgi:hypothetical protein
MNSSPSGKPRSGVMIAAQLVSPYDVYCESVIFRANLIDGAGFPTELTNARRG